MKRTKMKRTKRVLGLALAAVMCMGMLANSDTAYAASGTETSEKVLNIATIGETTTLSPLYMIADNRPTQKLLYEGLVKYVDGEIQPVLAEDWEMSEDGKQLTFYLRQGVTFHDGEPFNAEAAIANIEAWHINPSFTALPGVVNYTNIEAVDEYTIRLTYDTPYFAYINDFCWPDVCTMISPKQITQGDFQTVNGYAGTGPYIYDEYVAGQYTTFVRNENYWGEQPYYDKIVAKYIPDNASRVQALKTGEIDLIYGSAELSYEDYNQASDEKASWKKYQLAMPISNFTVVASKYVSVIYTVAISILGSIAFNSLSSIIFQNFDMLIWLFSIAAAIIIPLLWTGICLPLTYWFGFRSAQTMGLIVVIPMFYFVKYFEDGPGMAAMVNSVHSYVLITGIAAILIFGISLIISTIGYSRKN